MFACTNASIARVSDSIARANPSCMLTNESMPRISQLTRFLSSAPVARLNESMTSVHDSIASVSQLTCFDQVSEVTPLTPKLKTAESITASGN